MEEFQKLFMQRLVKFTQRAVQSTGQYRVRLSDRFFSTLSNRRIVPTINRTFATASKSSNTYNRISQVLQNPRFSVFTKSSALSFGTLLCAGFLGYGSNPKDTKDMKELKSKMEAIRKNYPNIRSFPVYTIYLYLFDRYRT